MILNLGTESTIENLQRNMSSNIYYEKQPTTRFDYYRLHPFLRDLEEAVAHDRKIYVRWQERCRKNKE
jgi:hypothetical protein